MAAAWRASSHASTVRRTRKRCEGSGGGVFALAVLIEKTVYFFRCQIRSGGRERAFNLECGIHSRQKHNSRRIETGYKGMNFSLSPHEKSQ
jgi:hypothetical protein